MVPQDNDKVFVPVLDNSIASGGSTMSISTGSTQSSAFNSATKFVRLVADTALWYEISSNPTATSFTSRYLPANVFVVEPTAGGWKIAIKSTS